MNKQQLKKPVLAALFAAITCLATFFSFPISGGAGYVHLGDAVVLIAGGLLGSFYGFAAAAIGSMLTDVLLGYVIYAPATFLIKGCMALFFSFFLRPLKKQATPRTRAIIVRAVFGALLAELFMILGYFIFDACLYGFGAAAVSVPFNAIQGILGTVISVPLVLKLHKHI